MMNPFGRTAADAAAEAVRDRVGRALDGAVPVAGIILGSGLGGLVDRLTEPVSIPYEDVPGFPRAKVLGHAGALLAGRLGDAPIIAFSGRFHVYEGHDVGLTAMPVRVMHALGARAMIVSNAAGGIRRTFRPGDLMLIDDHINLMFQNPLVGEVQPGDTRFPDMSDPYDRRLRALAREIALAEAIRLQEGVYAAMTGPAYETRAEVRMLERMGADATGMSTVPEVIVARAIGMPVLGISCITNLACGLSLTPPSHDEVLEVAARAGADLAKLVTGVAQRLVT